MPTWLAASDLLLTKPGGLTSAEAAAAGVPMGFLHPLPGQEEHNFDFLVNHGVAISLVDEEHLLGSVQAFLGDARGRERMREALADLGRPDALAELVGLVEGLAGQRTRARGAGADAVDPLHAVVWRSWPCSVSWFSRAYPRIQGADSTALGGFDAVASPV